MTSRYPISICMAGAVSAGAYSAGAMSVLLQAIRRWENSELDLPNKPKHRILIKGMSGASAGSIQAALSSLDLFSNSSKQELGRKAWLSVTLEKLFDDSDLKQESEIVKSVLNTQSLRTITSDVLDDHKWGSVWPEYVDTNYEVRLSVTNLRGIPYNIKLPETNHTDFGMSRHNEYLRYRFVNQQTQVDSDTGYVVKVGSESKSDILNLSNGALASSAFPLAFEPVKIERPTSEGKDSHDNKRWLVPEQASTDAHLTKVTYQQSVRPPTWNAQYGPKDTFFAVDGGVTNNEPLLEAFKILFGNQISDWGDIKDVTDDDEQDGRVLLIDPFPNSLDKDISESSLRIDKMFGALKSALIGHARFSEPIMVSSRLKERVGLVYPSNPLRDPAGNDQRPEQEKMLAIKSGPLAGFAGFLKKDFLEHDYELGRLNMQRFLRYHFTLPVSHPMVSEDQDYIKAFTVKQNGEKKVPIIPLYIENDDRSFSVFEATGEDRIKYYQDKLARFDQKFELADKKKLLKGLNNRLGIVGDKLIQNHNAGKLVRWGWRFFAKKTLSKKVVETIENSLATQDMLAYKRK